MRLKFFILIAAGLVAGGGVTVLMVESGGRKEHPAAATQLPVALSNYNQTFKLTTNPPLWREPAKNGATNGRFGN